MYFFIGETTAKLVTRYYTELPNRKDYTFNIRLVNG